MPPTADKHLEERILKAGLRLWRTHGDEGLTLRAVAREAGTTTPTLYKRFRNKEALRAALAIRIRDEITSELFSAPTIPESYRRFLRYAETHPHEYELLRLSIGQVWASGNPRPARTWLLSQLASRLGGDPESYTHVFDALFLLCHGTATLLSVTDDQELRQTLRENCIKLCDTLMENIPILRNGSKRTHHRGTESQRNLSEY
jgi:AcrR family transcriptional regulator